jgi:iron complex outermembrane receptor protein
MILTGRKTAAWAVALCLMSAPSQSLSQTPGPSQSATNPNDQGVEEAKHAASLDLEELADMDVKVTSASKKVEPLTGAPAAIYVLTGEEIRRGGFTTLPDALRMVPGLYVAQTDARIWQISARGFSDLNNNKMLVLVDGRSVYSPELGTVYWDALDIPLENIDRVEIIRGPGGTLWGANAVNGVINIITKSAAQTQGTMISSSAGDEEGYATTVRYGGQVGSHLSYELYGRASYWEPLQAAPAGDRTLSDQSSLVQGGTRVDWNISGKDVLTIEGGSYDGRFGSRQLPAAILTTQLVKGNNVLAHWTHTFSERSKTETIAYCDWYARFGTPGEKRTSCDVEFQQTYQVSPRQSLIWGSTFFSTGDDLIADSVRFSPERRRTDVVSGFAQYEVAILPNRLRILAGTKLEHNGYTGFEYQPQARAVWTPNKWNSFWTAVSRSVRIPSRNNSDLDLFRQIGVSHGLPVFQSLTGNPNLQSERIIAYEAGYRVQPAATLSFDLAIYYNKYNHLIVVSPAVTEVISGQILLNNQFINGPDAQSHGAELSAKWRPVHRWTISGAVTETRGDAETLSATPEHIFNIQSRADLPRKIELDAGLYRYSSLALATATPAQPLQSVPAFTRLDLGVAWHFRSHWTFSAWGRNLNSSGHVETRNTIFGDAGEYVPRALAFKLLWQMGQK